MAQKSCSQNRDGFKPSLRSSLMPQYQKARTCAKLSFEGLGPCLIRNTRTLKLVV